MIPGASSKTTSPVCKPRASGDDPANPIMLVVTAM